MGTGEYVGAGLVVLIIVNVGLFMGVYLWGMVCRVLGLLSHVKYALYLERKRSIFIKLIAVLGSMMHEKDVKVLCVIGELGVLRVEVCKLYETLYGVKGVKMYWYREGLEEELRVWLREREEEKVKGCEKLVVVLCESICSSMESELSVRCRILRLKSEWEGSVEKEEYYRRIIYLNKVYYKGKEVLEECMEGYIDESIESEGVSELKEKYFGV